jgi:hypothetical protein
MELEQSKLYEILIACLKKDKREPEAAAVSALSAEDWQNLLEISTIQRITSLLWHRLKQKNMQTLVPETSATQLKEAYRRNTLDNLRFKRELILLLSALNAERIPLILLKGIVLANTVYENIGLREMNDIDVLAQFEDLKRIADILMDMGYKPLQTIDANITRQANHHLPGLIKKGHVKYEVHWNLTRPGERYNIDPHGLWERADQIEIAGCHTLILSHEDMILHLCLHTSYQHRFVFGLRPFCDIAETIDHFGPALNWQTVVDRACNYGWQRGVYLALLLAIELSGASVPDHVMKKLQPEDMTGKILETTRAQIFTEKYFAAGIPPSFARLLESRHLCDRIKYFLNRVFLPRAVIATKYSVPMNSLKIYVCYLRRLYYLLRRHGRTFKKFQKNDDSVKSLTERTILIADWMD